MSAHEFGTDRMIEQEKNDFLFGQNNNYEDRSCFVINSISFLLPRTEYTLPQPVLEIDNRVGQIFEILALPIIINSTNQLGEELYDCNPPITNLLLNLSNNAELIGGILPPHAATVEGEDDVDNGQDQDQDEEENM